MLQKLFWFIKRYWFFIVLSFVAVVLAILWSRRDEAQKERGGPPLTTQPVRAPRLPGFKIADGIEMLFSFPPETPEGVSLINIEAQQAISEERAQEIAQVFGFSTNPATISGEEGKILIWNENDESLGIKIDPFSVSFDTDLTLFPLSNTGDFPKPDEINQKIETLLLQLSLSPGEAVLEKKTRFLSVGNGIIKETAIDKAQVLEVSFYPQLDGINIAAQEPEKPGGIIWIDRKGTLLRVEWEIPKIKVLSKIAYLGKTSSEIASFIKISGTIVSLGPRGFLDYSAESLKKIGLQGIKSALLPSGPALHPIFILRGTAETDTGEALPVYIYLPAIKSQYLIP